MSKRIALLSAVAFSALAVTASVVAPASAEDKKMMKSRPKVAARLPVACEYAAASGKEPLLF